MITLHFLSFEEGSRMLHRKMNVNLYKYGLHVIRTGSGAN